jgi:hypothetical protein
MRMSRQRSISPIPRLALAGPVRCLLALLLLHAAAEPAGALWREFVLASDRTYDDIIRAALVDATLSERLEILAALGQRADPFIGDYLDDFLLRHVAPAAEAEHLLRVLLESAFPPATPAGELAARVAPNQDALLAAAARLDSFDDPQLCAAIVRLIPLLPGGRADLLALVDRLVDRLERGDGLLDPREDGLLLDALDAMARTGTSDFLEPALAVARLSHEKAVVDRARETARALAPGGSGR